MNGLEVMGLLALCALGVTVVWWLLDPWLHDPDADLAGIDRWEEAKSAFVRRGRR